MGDSRSDNIQFCSFSILEKRVLQTLILACKKSKKFNTRFVSHINTKVHPRRLRGGQLGHKKLAAKVFNNGQESPWDTTLNEPVPQLICCFHDLPLRRSSPANSIVSRTVWLVQDSFLREEFSVKWDPRNQRNSIIGKISV